MDAEGTSKDCAAVQFRIEEGMNKAAQVLKNQSQRRSF